jgi:hypothetical protein
VIAGLGMTARLSEETGAEGWSGGQGASEGGEKRPERTGGRGQRGCGGRDKEGRGREHGLRQEARGNETLKSRVAKKGQR